MDAIELSYSFLQLLCLNEVSHTVIDDDLTLKIEINTYEYLYNVVYVINFIYRILLMVW